MKNKITLFALLLLSSLLSNAQTNYYFDSGDAYGDGSKNMIGEREYKWNTDNLVWNNVDSFDLHYNAGNQLTLQNYLEFDTAGAGTWINRLITTKEYNGNGLVTAQVDTSTNPAAGHRYEYTYNGNNREIQLLDKLWNSANNVWVSYRRYSTSRTSFDSVNVYLTEGWNPVNSIWINGSRLLHVYNQQNLDSGYTYENWYAANSEWVTGGRYMYSYDANANRTLILNQSYDTTFDVFKNITKTEYAYDVSNRMTSRVESDWNPNINIWQYHWRYSYTYNAQGLLDMQQVEKWSTVNLQWELWSLSTYTYDLAGRPIMEVYQNRANNAWENSGRQTYIRDANGYRTRYLTEFWNTNTLEWKNWSAIDYWYETKTPNGISEEHQDRLFVYPNPSGSPVLFVNAEKNLPYAIYDLTGRIVQQGNLQNGTNSLIFTEAKGMYLFRAGNTTTQIIKQ